MSPRHPGPWREPMMWLVAGIPLVTVMAGIGLLVKLSGGPSDDVARDDVQRILQAQVADLGPDEAALQLGLTMLLSLGDDILELRAISGRAPGPGALRLVLVHPLDASQDRELLLQPAGDAWRADGTWDMAHDWNLELTSLDGSWRLTGRLPRDARSARLQPALEVR
jgi:uncharacterized protein